MEHHHLEFCKVAVGGAASRFTAVKQLLRGAKEGVISSQPPEGSSTTPSPPKAERSSGGLSLFGKVQITAYIAVGLLIAISVVALYSQDQRIKAREDAAQKALHSQSPAPSEPTQTPQRALPTPDMQGQRQVSINNDVTGSGMGQITYEGQWSYQRSDGGLYSGDEHVSQQPGARARLEFTGTSVQLFAARTPESGIAQVSIDGNPVGTVDYSSSQRTGSEVVFSSPDLPYGRHQVTLLVQGQPGSDSHDGGTTVSIDRFVVGTLRESERDGEGRWRQNPTGDDDEDSDGGDDDGDNDSNGQWPPRTRTTESETTTTWQSRPGQRNNTDASNGRGSSNWDNNGNNRGRGSEGNPGR